MNPELKAFTFKEILFEILDHLEEIADSKFFKIN